MSEVYHAQDIPDQHTAIRHNTFDHYDDPVQLVIVCGNGVTGRDNSSMQ